MIITNKTVIESIKRDDLYSLTNNCLSVDKNDLIEVFNRLSSIKEQLTAYIGYYYIQFPNLRNQEYFSHNDNTCIYSISIIFYQHLIKQIDMFMQLCIALAIRNIELLIHKKCRLLGCHDSSSIYLKQLTPIDIQLKDELYFIGSIIIYRFNNKNNMKDYFYELTSDETLSNIEKYIDELLNKQSEIENLANKVCSEYDYIKFSIDGIILKIEATYKDHVESKYKYLMQIAHKNVLFSNINEDILKTACESLTYCVDYNYICNCLEILDTLQAIYEKLNIKDSTYPVFKCSNTFSLTTGEFGVGRKYKSSLHLDLLRVLNQIYASINVIDYPLKQVIIHKNAYVIEFSSKIVYEEKVYKVFQLKYFGKARLAVTDECGFRVSHRLRRLILKDWDLYREFIKEVDRYFEVDEMLIKAISKFKENTPGGTYTASQTKALAKAC